MAKHTLTDDEWAKLTVCRTTLHRLTRTHTPNCQCDLCTARVLIDNGEIDNVTFFPSAGQRVLDQIDIDEAMLR